MTDAQRGGGRPRRPAPARGRDRRAPVAPPKRIDPARDAACRRLERLCRRFPDLPVGGWSPEGLDARQAAFAHAIAEAATRRWLTIAHLIGCGLRQPFETLEPKVRAALLAGGAQLLFLDSVPARAAVFETVEWVKGSRNPQVSRLVNAAMRRLQEVVGADIQDRPRVEEGFNFERDEIPLASGGSITLSEEALPQDPLERLAAATSHPLGLLRLWARAMPLREVRRLALHGIVRPPVILNTAHAQTPPPAECTRVHDAPGHHVFTGDREALVALLAERRDIWVQDPASSLAVESISDLRPHVIVDACAGRGTKTRQLEASFREAQIIATDVDGERRSSLHESFRTSERVRVVEPKALLDFAGRADLVLLDVPCSNTGVLARRIEARYRAIDEKTNELSNMQRQIIADSMRLLAPGGRLLYSTCSLDPRENEDQLEWASRWHSLEQARVHRRLPGGLPGDGPEKYSDGSFAGLLA